MVVVPMAATMLVTVLVATAVVVAVPVAALITVVATAGLILHEVHGLPTSAVVAAMASPRTRVAGRHTQVDRALMHRDRLLLDDDGLRVDHSGWLIADVDAPIKPGL